MEKQLNTWGWGILLFLAVMWGSSFILIKKSLLTFSPYEVGAIRISLSFLALLPFAIKEFKKVKKKDWIYIIIVGLAGTGIPSFLFPLAETGISSAATGILNSLTPLFVLIFSVVIFKNEWVWTKGFGVLLGFVGAAMLILFGEDLSSGGNNWFAFYAILACIFYAMSANTVNQYLQEVHTLTITSVSFSIIGPPAILYLLMSDVSTHIAENPNATTSLISVSILAIGGTVIASLLFFRLVQLSNAVFASMVAYLIPIVALIFAFFDGESLSIIHLFGMILILIGVYLTRRQSK